MTLLNLDICKNCPYRANYLYAARDYDEETGKWFLTFRGGKHCNIVYLKYDSVEKIVSKLYHLPTHNYLDKDFFENYRINLDKLFVTKECYCYFEHEILNKTIL